MTILKNLGYALSLPFVGIFLILVAFVLWLFDAEKWMRREKYTKRDWQNDREDYLVGEENKK